MRADMHFPFGMLQAFCTRHHDSLGHGVMPGSSCFDPRGRIAMILVADLAEVLGISPSVNAHVEESCVGKPPGH